MNFKFKSSTELDPQVELPANKTVSFTTPAIDYIAIKNTIQGYTSRDYETIIDYQTHLTNLQITIKANRKDRVLGEILSDFFRFDYKVGNNWKHITGRVGANSLETYLDFIERINHHTSDLEPKIFDITFVGYSQLAGNHKTLFKSIVKDLQKFTPGLTIPQLNNLLLGKNQQTPILWGQSQYSFDYFIKSFKRIANYKSVLSNHFVFSDGAATVRNSGTDHEGKPYVPKLDEIVEKINTL